MNPRQHCEEIIAAIGAAETVEARWPVVAGLLGHMGIDQINYGVFVPGAGDRETADVRFLSTMRPDWIAYYGDRRLDLGDPHVTLVRGNNLVPYLWNDATLSRLERGKPRDAAEMASEAGLHSQWQVTLPDLDGAPVAIGGMALGSSLPIHDFAAILRGNEAALVTIAHLFHHCSIREVRRVHAGVPRLSPRAGHAGLHRGRAPDRPDRGADGAGAGHRRAAPARRTAQAQGPHPARGGGQGDLFRRVEARLIAPIDHIQWSP